MFSHVHLKTTELAERENSTIIKLPLHTTDLLQSLDVACFPPPKTYYEAKLTEHVHQTSANHPIRKAGFVNMLSSIWRKGLSESNVKAGFEATGIYPINSVKYKTERLDPAKLRTLNKLVENGSPVDDIGSPILIHDEAADHIEKAIEP